MLVGFNLKEKDSTVLVARRAKRVAEPVPGFGVVDTTKFGWCSGWESDQNHSACRVEFHSNQINKLVKCACDCHKENNV
jgi:hypothetical protein